MNVYHFIYIYTHIYIRMYIYIDIYQRSTKALNPPQPIFRARPKTRQHHGAPHTRTPPGARHPKGSGRAVAPRPCAARRSARLTRRTTPLSLLGASTCPKPENSFLFEDTYPNSERAHTRTLKIMYCLPPLGVADLAQNAARFAGSAHPNPDNIPEPRNSFSFFLI